MSCAENVPALKDVEMVIQEADCLVCSVCVEYAGEQDDPSWAPDGDCE